MIMAITQMHFHLFAFSASRKVISLIVAQIKEKILQVRLQKPSVKSEHAQFVALKEGIRVIPIVLGSERQRRTNHRNHMTMMMNDFHELLHPDAHYSPC